nr:UBN2 domain-containing protein [Tanacetum cinerariifolium]
MSCLASIIKQADWIADTNEEIDEQELEAHYSYMAKIQEVPTADLGTDTEKLEQPFNSYLHFMSCLASIIRDIFKIVSTAVRSRTARVSFVAVLVYMKPKVNLFPPDARIDLTTKISKGISNQMATVIEESKDLSTLSLNELVGNLKVYEVVLEKYSEASKNKKDMYTSLAIKAKKESSDKETSSSVSEDEEYAMAVRDFKKFFRRIGRFMRQPHDDKKASRRDKEDKKGKVD